MALYHITEQKFVALYSSLKSQDQPLKLAFFNDAAWAKWEFRNTIHLYKSEAFTLVPSLVFNPDHQKDYLSNTGITSTPNDLYSYQEIPIVNAFMVQKSAKPDSELIYAHLISYLALVQAQQYAQFLHFQIDVDGLFICAFKNSKLQLANRFPFKAKEDILYFISAVAQKNGIALDSDMITYSGFLRPKTSLKQLLGKYIKHLEPIGISSQVGFDTAINPLHQIYYSDTFILPICGL